MLCLSFVIFTSGSCRVGLNITYLLPWHCQTSFSTAGKALGVGSVPGMHRHILMSDKVLGREHKLHHSWYNPWCTLSSPASPSTSLQPRMPRLSAILYELPKKQITMHYKMKLAFLIWNTWHQYYKWNQIPSNHMPPHKYSGWWGKRNEWWIAGQQRSLGSTAL